MKVSHDLKTAADSGKEHELLRRRF